MQAGHRTVLPRARAEAKPHARISLRARSECLRPPLAVRGGQELRARGRTVPRASQSAEGAAPGKVRGTRAPGLSSRTTSSRTGVALRGSVYEDPVGEASRAEIETPSKEEKRRRKAIIKAFKERERQEKAHQNELLSGMPAGKADALAASLITLGAVGAILGSAINAARADASVGAWALVGCVLGAIGGAVGMLFSLGGAKGITTAAIVYVIGTFFFGTTFHWALIAALTGVAPGLFAESILDRVGLEWKGWSLYGLVIGASAGIVLSITESEGPQTVSFAIYGTFAGLCVGVATGGLVGWLISRSGDRRSGKGSSQL